MGKPIPYLKSIYVRDCYASQNFEIDFSPEDNEPFRHLILTGKNGTGKTTILNAIVNCSSGINPTLSNEILSIQKTQEKVQNSVFFSAFFPAIRQLSIEPVEGPKKLEELSSRKLLQYLVNKKSQQAFELLKKDTNKHVVNQIEEWFSNFEEHLRILFGFNNFSLEFDGDKFDFYCKVPGQTKFSLRQLSDGYSSVLYIFSSLILAAESLRVMSQDLPAIVTIDEIETHLHLELQETILPFLTGMFPKIQFIVATHSPAVIASIDNATVYDLSQHKTIDEDLRGYPYQFLMKEHFGIESEYSIVATKLLKESRILAHKGNNRTEQESYHLQELAKKLHDLSPSLAFELYLELEREQLEANV